MSGLDTTYQPGPVPNNVEDLPTYLYDELYRIAAALQEDDEVAAGGGICYGPVPSFPLNTTPVLLANYAEGVGSADPVAGTLIIPANGAYTFRAWISGAMTSPNNNNQYYLEGILNGAPLLLAVNDVAHNSTDNIALAAAGTRLFTEGDVLQLRMQASASMGTCTLDNTTLEIEPA